MSTKKIIFVAFAMENERQRDFLKGQSLHHRASYDFVDLSDKEAYETGWKDKVRTRIRRCHGVMALVSRNSLQSTGQKWEIARSKEEGKKVIGVWAYVGDRTEIAGVRTVAWSDANITAFIDSL